jgi:hypothetical protein
MTVGTLRVAPMFVPLLLAVSCRHHPGTDRVHVPPAPRHCAAWYEIDAQHGACHGMDQPRTATMVMVPRTAPGLANCMLRCDQARPRWEVDVQAEGFPGNILCTVDGGPKLRLSVGGQTFPMWFVRVGSNPCRSTSRSEEER